MTEPLTRHSMDSQPKLIKLRAKFQDGRVAPHVVCGGQRGKHIPRDGKGRKETISMALINTEPFLSLCMFLQSLSLLFIPVVYIQVVSFVTLLVTLRACLVAVVVNCIALLLVALLVALGTCLITLVVWITEVFCQYTGIATSPYFKHLLHDLLGGVLPRLLVDTIEISR
ncbi:hypothetical protein C8Q72DRAFT_842428 [Fomitopsis betulina]|nr:hypothetical protein C8Q72DRAFT_842428 [Fomitopsis betulina]